MKSEYAEVSESGSVVLKSEDVGDPGANELLIRSEFSSMSPGTESSLISELFLPLPQCLGYSVAGIVESVGSRVSNYKPGDRVVATAKHARYQCLDQSVVTPVPDGVDMEQAAFFNLAHTALYGIRQSGLQLGEGVLVMGQGLVGALTATLARLAGAAPVIVTDMDTGRLELAKKMGAHYAFHGESQKQELDDLVASLDFGGVPVVFEATGARAPLEQAVTLLSERGRLVMLSTVHGESAPNISEAIMMKGASLIGAYVNSKPFRMIREDMTITEKWPPSVINKNARYANKTQWSGDEDIRVLLNLLRYGALDLSEFITHRFSAEQIPEAYKLVIEKDASLVGGLIDWRK